MRFSACRTRALCVPSAIQVETECLDSALRPAGFPPWRILVASDSQQINGPQIKSGHRTAKVRSLRIGRLQAARGDAPSS